MSEIDHRPTTRWRHWFGRAMRALRDTWSVFGLALLLFLGLNYLIGPEVDSQRVGRLFASDTYREASNIHDEVVLDELAMETEATHDSPFVATRLRWEPLTYWRSRSHAGKWINVDEQGLRHTVQPPPSGAAPSSSIRPVRIFCFGGSTMWGSCVCDEATIPSQLAAILFAERLPVEVTNFGQMGYVSTQERITLEQELARGNQPDLVVFYDGFNDIGAAMANSEPGLPADEFERPAHERLWRDPSFVNLGRHYLHNTAIARLFQPPWHEQLSQQMKRKVTAMGTHALAIETINCYFGNVRIIDSLARGLGFDARFYWQPMLFTRNEPTENELAILSQESGAVSYHRSVSQKLREVERLLPEQDPTLQHWRNLADIFNGDLWREQTLYFDTCHLADIGNRAVAQEIAQDLIPLLRQRLEKQTAASTAATPSE
jgi:lysophospholipase L1-like esterase